MVDEAARFLSGMTRRPPCVAILTGTGLGETVEFLEIEAEIDYGNIPYFPRTTVESHAGKLIFGTFSGIPVLAFKGRFHLYEGYHPLEVTFPIRLMKALGVGTLILTNASGGLNPEFSPGSLMVIADHINLTGENPLVGPNESTWGERFPDMSRAYSPELMNLAFRSAASASQSLKTGIYAGLKGPSLETPAEIRFLRKIGADAVGFSTVQEVITAVHAGIHVLGLSIITNVHRPESPVPAYVKDIIEVAENASSKLAAVIKGILENLHAE